MAGMGICEKSWKDYEIIALIGTILSQNIVQGRSAYNVLCQI